MIRSRRRASRILAVVLIVTLASGVFVAAQKIRRSRAGASVAMNVSVADSAREKEQPLRLAEQPSTQPAREVERPQELGQQEQGRTQGSLLLSISNDPLN